MLDFINRPVENLVGSSGDTAKQDPSSPLPGLVRCIVKAADDRKASDIVVLSVGHVTTLTSYLIICTGTSRPQNQAIAGAIAKDVQEQYGQRPGQTGVPEGSAESGWILLDFGSVMVHIMAPKSRLYYNVEGQWRDKGGVAMDLSDILVPNSGSPSDSSDDVAAGEGRRRTDEEDDPFWS